jgi:hypothetical protein
MDMVEDVFTPEVAEKMLADSGVSSGGAYTTVGFYDHTELIDMVEALSKLTNTPSPELVKSFGRYMLPRFKEGHRQFFEGHDNAYDFLETVHDTVHREVLKLYRDAELPQFETLRVGDKLLMTYRSKRPFAELAAGLIEGAFDAYDEAFVMDREDSLEGDTHVSVFHLQSLGKR